MIGCRGWSAAVGPTRGPGSNGVKNLGDNKNAPPLTVLNEFLAERLMSDIYAKE